MYFKTGADLTQPVKDEADKLRSKGVDFNKRSTYYGNF